MMHTSMALLLLAASTLPGAAPTFQDLMNPAVFPDAQRGMVVESAEVGPGGARVVTTGAEMTFDAANGIMDFRQRIGHERPVLAAVLSGGVDLPFKITYNKPGLAFLQSDAPLFNLRVNGDSLFMLHAIEPMTITLKRRIEPGFTASYQNNHVLFDEWGGFGVFCSDTTLTDGFDPHDPVTARYDLPAGAVLWFSICPPKPYDWERSLTDHVLWHWSNESAYPADADLVRWSKEGNIVLLQAEMMLWKDWNLAFVPRLGEAEFARVRDTIHANNMRFIVYTSPAYFFKGTPFESYAMNSFENFTNWPPARGVGDNIDVFMDEITKVMHEYKPDGLYFDGQYYDCPAALYALARRTRELLGEDGILEWHSTTALGEEYCFLPQADAYVDFILRGEGRDTVYGDQDYLRYFVSCYNTSNSIGVLCNNGPRPTADLVRRLLSVNGRLHTIAGWLDDAPLMEMLRKEYRDRLTPDLRAEIDRTIDARQEEVAVKAAKTSAEHRMLKQPPTWGAPVLECTFDAIPDWTQVVSPANAGPFQAVDGVLAVKGKASTHAYLETPLGKEIQGIAVRVKRGTDGGMSWGPSVCVRWADGALLRIGLRSDGKVQSDITGRQRLSAPEFIDAGQWIWLRARWGERNGVLEYSLDGQTYSPLWFFDHGGAMNAPAATVAVGKVPFSGKPEDYSDPGADGESYFDVLTLY